MPDEASHAARPLPVTDDLVTASDDGQRGTGTTGVRDEMRERASLGAVHIWARDLIAQSPSWLASMVIHMVLLIVLALLTLPKEVTDEVRELFASRADTPLDKIQDAVINLPSLPDVDAAGPALSDLPRFELNEPILQLPELGGLASGDAELIDPDRIGFRDIPGAEERTGLGSGLGDGGKGRGDGFRQRRDTREGRAVAAALKWLAAHQLPDGGWCYDHTAAMSCQGLCRNAGSMAESRIAATGMALLPFLGAGQTHTTGKYKETVRRGLYFLTSQMKVSPNGGSLYEAGGRMYAHGIASIAICEAYAMTRDKALLGPAQAAIRFICYAQDPVGGGWRYEPQQPGDTSVVGWQIMALKSGHMAYIDVPMEVAHKASRYLDGVQYESGARYGYTDPGEGSSATTAIGLLCRMLLGWKKDEPGLQRGVEWLARQGPAQTDMYYNYYATQVMRHFGGQMWQQWDVAMKRQLLESQAIGGHEAGSWFVKHTHSRHGGRLYCTAMAAMILEVYYRHLPIYGSQSVEDDFPE